ncbi:MAG: hypothetical protein L6R48_02005 [Planctomycetes bacterium]|nr:hypothetical protein [Planctomycetota bacterium]
MSWSLTAATAAPFNSLALSAEFAVQALAGGSWTADDKSGTFPALHGEAHLFNAPARTLALTIPGGQRLELAFPQPTMVTLQDNRRWGGQTFVVRIGRAMGTLAAGERATVAMTVAVPGGLRTRRDLPVTLAAGDEWVPLATELDIEPGSALDFAALGLTDGPCGSKGRVIATADGHFAYADEPQKPKRFYGVNLCFSAQYLPKEQVDRLLDRLVRLGYNSVRIHHYEFRLGSQDWKPGFDWDPARVDQLDYLMAGCARRGLWLTTDLYVSRPVAPRQIGLGGEGLMKPDRYKMLIPVHEPAFQDWATFARKLLDHVNPYTGKRLAEDPALAWVSLINEGWIGGHAEVRANPQWTAAWNRWLAARYPDRDALDLALGDLADSEDPAAGTVALPAEAGSGTRRARACQVFKADTERAMVERMRTLLRDELKCPALLTDLNYGSVSPSGQGVRATFDYVDDHFYVDHPPQLRLPVSGRYANPVRDGAPGGTASAGARIWGKPFTVSEYNYTAPGRFRGMGGALTGALASLQDWDALWRFAYAHKDAELFAPAPMDWFNLVSDPLSQAGDRAAILLYLRRDLAPAPQRLALVLTKAQLRDPPSRLKLGTLDWLAWTTRIGCAVVEDAAQAPAGAIAVPARGAGDRDAQLALPADGVQRSETGEVVIDSKRGVLTIDTPRSAGGYADPGLAIDAARAGVRIDGLTTGATVLVSSLDGAPIRSARRLLITHLTDLQNTGAKYNESSRQSMTDWGKLPHLVRDGAASVQIALTEAGRYQVWALSGGGRRLEKVAAVAGPGGLTIPLRVRGTEGARMAYEVVLP